MASSPFSSVTAFISFTSPLLFSFSPSLIPYLFKGYRSQFYFRTTDVTGACELPEGTEMVMPGDNVQMEVTLIHPIAMEEGLRFAIREGGRTVGAGVVAKIIE